MTVTERARRRFDTMWEWSIQPPNLKRWKVALTVGCAVALMFGQYNSTKAQNAERIHDIRCSQAQGRAENRAVLFKITTLSDVFGHSTEVDLYEKSMHSIIDLALTPIVVNNCPIQET